MNATTVTRTPSELDRALSPARTADATVVLVPTMGALHRGHLDLMDHAKDIGDVVVTSIFVNPAQFGPGEDYERYPRRLDDDVELCEKAGVGVVFAPEVDTMYPSMTHDISIDPGPLGGVLEGVRRPTHFRGVLTVVAKLAGLVEPQMLILGEKDYQQLVLVRAMLRTIGKSTAVIGHETVREPDGLALSSRNAYLTAEEREVAATVPRALQAGVAAASGGERAVLAAARAVLEAEPSIDLDYLALTDGELGEAGPATEARLLVAVNVGATRLIDNLPLVLGK